LEYGLFKERLQELDEQKREIAETMATALELIVSAALTAATGGAAAGVLLASLASTVTGMLAREALLGDEYELASRENAKKLAMVLAGAATGAVGGELAADLEKLAEQFPKLAPALQNATQDIFS